MAVPEWVKNPDNMTLGITLNPITGCLNRTEDGLCHPGVFPCYAYRMANTRLKARYLTNKNIAPVFKQEGMQTYRMGYGLKKGFRIISVEEAQADPFYPRFWTEKLRKQICRENSPEKGIFLCDMSDLFGIGVPEEWTHQILLSCKCNPQNRYYLLTKQYQNLVKFSPFPDNCWVGATACNSDMFDSAFRPLMKIDARVRYLSLEPLLDWTRTENLQNPLEEIDWIIIGACTGTRSAMEALVKRYPDLTLIQWGKKWTAQPRIAWVKELVEAADCAGIPVFLKDNLKPLLNPISGMELMMNNCLFERYMVKADEFKLRQEMPDRKVNNG